MEIITHVMYDSNRHTLVQFLKNDVKPFYIQLMDPRVVRKTVDGNSHTETVEQLIQHRWTGFRVASKTAIGQLIPVKLADKHWAHIHLVINGQKDRMVILVAGIDKTPKVVHLAYAGSKEVFDDYIKGMNINDFELYSGLTHHIEED